MSGYKACICLVLDSLLLHGWTGKLVEAEFVETECLCNIKGELLN